MAEGTYEYVCMRAELLGIAKPDQEEFEKAAAEQRQQELDAAESELLEMQEETMRDAGGQLDELNSILTSTQEKLNRFKHTACGSLTRIFSRGSVDATEINREEDGAAATANMSNSRRNTTAGNLLSDHTSVPTVDTDSNEDSADVQPRIPIEKIRSAKANIEKKMTSQLDKLDSLINKAEHAEISMTEQTKQMQKIAKK